MGDEEETLSSARKGKTEKEGSDKLDKKELRKRRAEIITKRSKILGPLERGIEKAEHGIDTREKRIKELNIAMQEAAHAKDGKRITAISMEIHTCEEEIEALFKELEELTHAFDKHNAVFEERLAQVGSD